MNRSATSRATYTRSIPEQVWPAFAKEPHSAPAIAWSRFASARTIIGSLPPSSSTDPLSRRAHSSATPRPVSTLPVKNTFATPERTSAAPVPGPCTTRTSPSGTPARSNTLPIRSPISGVSEAGLSTTPLPAISASATSPKGMLHG